MRVGYIRISTKEQNTARQDELMKQLGVEKVYTDKVSGKNTDSDGLSHMTDLLELSYETIYDRMCGTIPKIV